MRRAKPRDMGMALTATAQGYAKSKQGHVYGIKGDRQGMRGAKQGHVYWHLQATDKGIYRRQTTVMPKEQAKACDGITGGRQSYEKSKPRACVGMTGDRDQGYAKSKPGHVYGIYRRQTWRQTKVIAKSKPRAVSGFQATDKAPDTVCEEQKGMVWHYRRQTRFAKSKQGHVYGSYSEDNVCERKPRQGLHLQATDKDSECRMELVYDDIHEGIAKIVIVGPANDDEEYVQHLLQLNNKVDAGGAPLYIHCSKEPTLDETVQLFKLCPEQALPFKVMARTLKAEGTEGMEKPAQLKCSILGQAGTGKSEILKAFPWYAFQHKLTSLIIVSAYTWKAGTLVGSSSNPGVTTTRAFGTKTTYTRFKQNGDTIRARDIFDSRKCFLLVDEISFISSEHITSSSRPGSKILVFVIYLINVRGPDKFLQKHINGNGSLNLIDIDVNPNSNMPFELSEENLTIRRAQGASSMERPASPARSGPRGQGHQQQGHASSSSQKQARPNAGEASETYTEHRPPSSSIIESNYLNPTSTLAN
eukprot:gene15025-21096_t